MDQLLPETRGPVLHEPKTESLTQRYDSLIELYTLADRLLDFTTAELLIDKRWSWSENRSRLSFVCFTLGFWPWIQSRKLPMCWDLDLMAVLELALISIVIFTLELVSELQSYKRPRRDSSVCIRRTRHRRSSRLDQSVKPADDFSTL